MRQTFDLLSKGTFIDKDDGVYKTSVLDPLGCRHRSEIVWPYTYV